MSSLFSSSNRNRNSNGLAELARSVGSPQAAQARVEEMLRTGQVSQRQYDEALRMAQGIARSMGIR